MRDSSIPDIKWWFSNYAEFEDFCGIGKERALILADKLLDSGISYFIVNRMLRANKLPHGPCNMKEEKNESISSHI